MSLTAASFSPENVRAVNKGRNMRKLKHLSALLALIFALSVFGAIAFEAAEYDHDCAGEGCAVCMALEMCDNLLRLGSSAAAAAAVMISAALLSALSVSIYKVNILKCTLISLKVRLDD